MSVTAAPTLLDTSLCTLDLKARSRDAALAEIVDALGAAVCDAPLLRESLQRREHLATTAIGKGVALPNVRSLGLAAPRIVLARTGRGVAWEGSDEPVRLVCAVLSPADWSDESHHEALARAASALRLQRARQRLLEAAHAAECLVRWREAMA